jgi:hypothetical protein
MIAAGFYVTRAVGPAEFFEASTGSKGVKVPFQVSGEPVEWVGWLTEKAEARTAESLALLGFDGEHEASVTGREVQLVIEYEEYETTDGEKRQAPRIKWINDPNRRSGLGTPMSAGDAAAAKQRLKGLVLAQRQKLAGATSPAAQSVAPPIAAGRPKF